MKDPHIYITEYTILEDKALNSAFHHTAFDENLKIISAIVKDASDVLNDSTQFD